MNGPQSLAPSVPLVDGDIDRFSLFDGRWFGHATQRGNSIDQAFTGGENCDHFAEAGDFQVDVHVGVSELRRNANDLTVAGFEGAGSWHGNHPRYLRRCSLALARGDLDRLDDLR